MNERPGNSDYLLKSNNELEKKLKLSKSKLNNVGNMKSPQESKDKTKKINLFPFSNSMVETGSNDLVQLKH